MKFRFTLLSFILCFDLAACDICGNFMGLTPYDNQSQLSLFHRYRVFNGYRNYQQRSVFFVPGAYRTAHGPVNAGDSMVTISTHSSKDYESYKVFELRGKYFLSPRLEVNCIVPMQQIRLLHDGNRSETTGLADPSFFAAWHLIRRTGDLKFRQRLLLGAGIKFPVGAYDRIDNRMQRLFLLNQNGSGSWDHFYYVNYTLRHRIAGLNSNSMIKLNGANRFNERLGNSFNQSLLVFVPCEWRSWKFFPALLGSYEYCKGLYVDGKLVPATSMNLLMLGPSIDLVRNNLVFNVCCQVNARERVSSQSLSAAGRLVVGVTWNFMQKKYLINS